MNKPGRPVNDWEKLKSLFGDYQKGDQQATRILFESLQKSLKPFFRMRLNSVADSEDLLQVTLLKIHFARERYDHSQSLKTWVFTIASRSLIDHWRGKDSQAEALNPESSYEDIASDTIETALKFELTTDINEALKTLKPTERSIVYLYGVEGFTMAEVAEVLAISEGATKLRAHRAYKDLRKVLTTLTIIWFSIRNLWI